MRKLQLALALSMVMAAAVSTPAWAQSQVEEPLMETQTTVISVDPDAFDTIQNPLTTTIEDDRIAAVTYLDDVLALMKVAESSIQADNVELARSALVGISGKLSNAYLIHYQDRRFSEEIGRMAMRADEALTQMETDPEQVAGILIGMRSQVASAYRTQVAQMGGGAGAGLEDLDQLDQLEMQDQEIED